MGTKNQGLRKKGNILHRRRILVTVLLIVMAGFGTLAAFVLTQRAKADIDYDPFFTLSTGPAKVRIYQPLEKSVGNESTFTAQGTAPPNSTVSIAVDGVSKGTTTADARGAWSKSVSGVAEGDHQLTAQATLAGPFSVISATNYIPGYSIVDLPTNGLVSSSVTGAGIALYAFGGTGASGNVVVNDVIKVSDEKVYLVRDRTVTVLDVAQQKATKTITMGNQFLTSEETPTDSGDTLRAHALSPGGDKVYLLFSNGTNSKIIALETTSDSLVENEIFPATSIANATDLAISSDGLKLFVGSENSDQFATVTTVDGVSSATALAAPLSDMSMSPTGGTLYISKSLETDTHYIAKLDPTTGIIDETAINIGGTLGAPFLYASSKGEKLYVAAASDTNLRVFDAVSGNLLQTINVGAGVDANKKIITENSDGTRLYVGLEDQSVAIIEHDTDAMVGKVTKPADNYTSLNSAMVHNGKLYTTYDRTPDIAGDILDPSGNPSKLYSSLGVANANTSSTIVATAVTVNGASSGILSDPVAINPLTLSNTTNFSVGDPVTITSPATDSTLDTATPTVTGKGPRNSTIKLTINGGSPQNVQVDSAGNWQKVLTLPKNRNNTIAATYENKRTQLIIPNTFIFGADIAKNQLSVIDGESGLQQQPLTLPPIGVSSIKINTSAAINPSGQRYYLVNSDFTTFASENIQMLINGQTPESVDVLQSLLQSQLGGVDVYSSQTRQLITRIQIGNGQIPIGIALSPDGTKAMVQVFDIQKQIDLLRNQQAAQAELPLSLVKLNLLDNTTLGEDIEYSFALPGVGDPLQDAKNIAGLVSGSAISLSKPGVFNSDGTKFYTAAFRDRNIAVIDYATSEISYIELPSSKDLNSVISIQVSPGQNTLYASHLEVDIPDDGQSLPSFTPKISVINLSNNQIIGTAALPAVPLFNIAVDSSGTKLYMITLNILDIITIASNTSTNPQAILADSLPQFDLGIYDFATGSYTTRPVTKTEIPYNLVISPDDSKVFIPTLVQNSVHVYDVASNQMNIGNAPIMLDGISTAFSTTNNIGEVTLGVYSNSVNYYVPPDAPAIPQPTVVDRTGNTQFRFISTPGSTTTVSADALEIPNQTVQVVKQTAQAALGSTEDAVRDIKTRTWFVYFVYGAFISILGLTGYTIWKTDMLLGASVNDDYV